MGLAKQEARKRQCRQVSLLAFEQNEGAIKLYERNGFGIVDRAPVVPHEFICYTGEVLLMTALVQPGPRTLGLLTGGT
jgi:ribosomal protein S18 acetylase RimI-like enzyme